jgi:hypothetical protein
MCIRIPACPRAWRRARRPARGGRVGGAWPRSLSESWDAEAAEFGTVLDTKKAGRAAPPGESLFSSLFNVAARGGKSPRVSIVLSVYGRPALSSSPATSWVLPAFPTRSVTLGAARASVDRVTGERRAEVVPVCREPVVPCVDVLPCFRARVSRPISAPRTFRASSSSSHPLPDDPFALLDHAVT